ncbi:MAG TPA: RelA/SpoT family protein [Thiolinea sp.]|nr:RelA/SpoT family protein [Thiolinea sp.]
MTEMPPLSDPDDAEAVSEQEDTASVRNASVPGTPDDFFLAADLMNMVERYLPESDARRVHEAYNLASLAHKHVVRKSGEPYITHPLEVARILADLHMDAETLGAALLHDVIEDTDYTREDIESLFGLAVGHLVDGVTKLEAVRFSDKQEATIASFQKMMQAMTDDFRVVLIKLADRLHNLRTLGFKNPVSQRRIARETISMYIPLASRMGLNKLRREMQLLAFQHLYPWRSQILQKSLDRYFELNDDFLQTLVGNVTNSMTDSIPGSMVFLWKKNLYRIYERIRRYGRRFDCNREVLNVRVVVKTVDECYRALGILHSLYPPKIGSFYDFIASPKTYGFQALQTVVLTSSKQAVRFQIQTRYMYEVEQYGIAAQWRSPDLYSERKRSVTQEALEAWQEQVRELGTHASNASEFYSDMQADLFLTEIYAFTPRGEVKEFPRGATVLDYAYAIHTDVGEHCVAARIDGEEVPLRTRIPNGATIEIITDPSAMPQPAWLNMVVTARARSNIRNWLRQQRQSERVELGRQLLNQSLRNRGSSLEQIGNDRLAALVRQFKLRNPDELFLAIAQREHCHKLLAQRLLGLAGQEDAGESAGAPLLVKGASGMMVHFNHCCYPLPTEPILARLDPGSGLEVHRDSCPVLLSGTSPASILSVAWADDWMAGGQAFLAGIRTRAYNVVGVLHHITELMHELKVNIESIHTSGDQNIKDTEWELWVRDLAHLQETMRQVEHVPSIIHVQRIQETPVSLVTEPFDD